MLSVSSTATLICRIEHKANEKSFSVKQSFMKTENTYILMKMKENIKHNYVSQIIKILGLELLQLDK